MKWEAPALASVSSREPAPIQKPIATERTLGTRSEITRSPESSSERTYFWTTFPLSLGERGHEGAVGLQQEVDELVDLAQRQLGSGVRVEHGRVVDVFALAGESGFHRQRLHVHVRLDQGGQLRRQRAHGPRHDAAGS